MASTPRTEALFEDTVEGLHDFLFDGVLAGLLPGRRRAIDLGGGTGALAARLGAAGLTVLAVDRSVGRFAAPGEVRELDLDQAAFAEQLGPGTFDLVTAVEVIEHVRSPIDFLTQVRRLLRPDGVAVVTTPNLDTAPARLKFLLTGRLRMMDEPTHISPIFLELLTGKYLPLAGLRLERHRTYPPDGWVVTRRRYAWFFQILARVVRGPGRHGDVHVLTLRPDA